MNRRYHLLIWRLSIGLIFAFPASALASGLPEGYAIHNGTESPDGSYGIAVPAMDLEDSGTGENVNYLVQLKTHQVLGKIACDEYFEGQNLCSLETHWAPDSKWCVVLYEGRFGFSSIAILVPKPFALNETNIGDRINESLKSAAGDDGYASAYFRFATGRKLLVRALAFTGNPKINDQNTRYARFEGTFDLNSGKWTNLVARRMNLPGPHGDGEVYSAVYLALDTAYSDDSAGQSLDDLDATMNQVYMGVRAVLPPERFAKVKKDQIAWLKQRDAISSMTEKSKLIEARIRFLQDILW